MRIACSGIRHWVFHNVPRLRIQLADVSLAVCGKPDVALFVRNQSMWSRTGGFEFVFLDLSCGDIQTSDHVTKLPRIPQRAIRPDFRIVWMCAGGKCVPFLDGDADVVGNKNKRCSKKNHYSDVS